MLILLPPSEGKTAATAGDPVDPAALWLPKLAPARRRVLGRLVAMCRRTSARGVAASLDTLGLTAGQRDEIARNAGLLVDLRSGMYAAFWRPTGLSRIATVRVLHEVNGKRQVVSHFNKATKGRLVRALAVAGPAPDTVDDLVGVLRDLKFTVEERAPGRLDVVVAEL